ncbi:WxL domain-containing protein [Pseudolactococcus reticulitermitis]|uniref:Uncharacterized protein n=1 Tax=Pseudolactococcus reticulitermitis TaxID=2025039 RepID=A0A224WZR9_9LACT|nr:WxL domain-containing protein [Lactococcus reticulitermitis]GAX47527.1 hypothetical protein RsY01_1127 [Lactococcus reticulitermitis]
MEITSNKTVWRYLSVFFLFVSLIAIGGKVQAKDVASGTELKKALEQGESSITVTSPMLTLPKNTDITHDVTINFNQAVLFFEDNQTPALIGKNNCAVRIQNAFVTHDAKKTAELTYGGAPKLNGKGEMTAYYTNAFGIVSGLQAHGAQLKSLTFENINWDAANIPSANRFLIQETGETYFEGKNTFNYCAENNVNSLIANSLIVTKGTTGISEMGSSNKALWYSGNDQAPEMRLEVKAGAKLKWLGQGNNYGWIEHNAASKDKKFIFDNQGTVVLRFGRTTTFKTTKSRFWQVRFFLREKATTFIYSKSNIWDLEMFEVDPAKTGEVLTSENVSAPDKSSFYFRAFKDSVTLLDSDDHLVSASNSSRWPKKPYYSENRIYTAITEVSTFVMSSANQDMLNSNPNFKLYANLEKDMQSAGKRLRFYAIPNSRQGWVMGAGYNATRDIDVLCADINAIVSYMPGKNEPQPALDNYNKSNYIIIAPADANVKQPEEPSIPVTPPPLPIVIPPVTPKTDWSVCDEETLQHTYNLEDMDIYGAAKLFSRTSQLTQDFEVNLLAKNAFKVNVTLKTSQVDFPHDLVYRTANGDIPLVPNQPLEFLTDQQMASADGLHFTTTFGAQEGVFVSSSRQIAEKDSYYFTLEWTLEETGQTPKTLTTDGRVTFDENGLMLNPNQPHTSGNAFENPNQEQNTGALDLRFTKWPKTFNFGTIDLSALTQAKGFQKKALNKAANDVTDLVGDQMLQVFDGRVFKSGVNWSVTAKATTFKEKNVTGAAKEIQGAKIILTNLQGRTTDPSSNSGLRNETGIEILADDQNTSTTTLFGNENGKQVKGWSDLFWQPDNVLLDIPQNQAKVGTFESVVTWTLVDQAFK